MLIKKYALPFKKNKNIRMCNAPFHKGKLKNCIDFYMPKGTNILATREGIITKLINKYSKSYKNSKYANQVNLIIIRHEDGEKSVYAHLKKDSIKVKLGQKVKKGQIIALNGQIGYATYPHLHFGVYKKNKNLRVRLKKNKINKKSQL